MKWWTVYEDDHGVQCQAVDENGQWAQRRDVQVLEKSLEGLAAAFEHACQTVAEMHKAAVGSTRGPIRGVIEDVADLKERHDKLVAQVVELQAARRKDAMRILFLEGKATCDGCSYQCEEQTPRCKECLRDAIMNMSDNFERG